MFLIFINVYLLLMSLFVLHRLNTVGSTVNLRFRHGFRFWSEFVSTDCAQIETISHETGKLGERGAGHFI